MGKATRVINAAGRTTKLFTAAIHEMCLRGVMPLSGCISGRRRSLGLDDKEQALHARLGVPAYSY